MYVRGGSFAGYPCGLASRQRDLLIRRDGKLERDVGAAILNAPDVPGMRPPRLLRADPDFHQDAGFRHAPMAGTRDLGIGVDQRRNHARDAGRDDRVSARRRLAVMRAGLERHVQRGAAGRVAGTRKRLGLGVGAATRLRPTAPDDDTVLDDHRADRGIGPGTPEPTPAKRKCEAHEAAVVRVVGWFGDAQRVQFPATLRRPDTGYTKCATPRSVNADQRKRKALTHARRTGDLYRSRTG